MARRQSVKAVSYTHLDVYKRQPSIRRAFRRQHSHCTTSASFPQGTKKERQLWPPSPRLLQRPAKVERSNIEAVIRLIAVQAELLPAAQADPVFPGGLAAAVAPAGLEDPRRFRQRNRRGLDVEHVLRRKRLIVGPVSYTHLDVYKRQAMRSSPRRTPPRCRTARQSWRSQRR